MAQLGVIDSREIAERNDFTPVPKDRYRLMITASEMKPTKDGQGQYLALELDIQSGDHAGRKLFERLNLENKNSTAVDIAYRTLGEIIRACNKTTISDSEELHGILMEADVDVDPGRPYEKNGQTVPGNPQNVIKKYHSTTSSGAQQQKAAAPAGKPAATTAPWKRA